MELTLKERIHNQQPLIDYAAMVQEEKGFKSKALEYLKEISESKCVKDPAPIARPSKMEMQSSLMSTILEGLKSGVETLVPEVRPIVNTVEKTNTFVKKVFESAKSDTAKIIKATSERFESFKDLEKKKDSRLKETIETNSITVDKLEKAPAIKSLSKASRLLIGLKKALAIGFIALKVGLKLLLTGIASYLIAGITGFGEKFVNGFVTYVYEPIEKLTSFIKETGNNIWKAVTSLPSEFAESIKAVFDKFNPFNNDKVKETISNTKESIKESSVGKWFVRVKDNVSSSTDRISSNFEKVRSDSHLENVTHVAKLASNEIISWLQSANNYLNEKASHVTDQVKETFNFQSDSQDSNGTKSETISQLQTEATIVQQQAQQRRDAVNEKLAGGINAITSVQNVSQTTNNYAAPFSFTGDESMGIRNYGAQPAR
ncbi:TPA: hypothetical protein ACGUON_000725 [Vibrio vulnificus]|nr:hypothetical protein [Vibrio vulnificus]